ncbi:UNVERIFIED_CONTAM: hypothetical protein GTU68_022305, partial [Idotea baltica]|nr:hypothetical protein [Idotea baltica]
KEIITIAVGQAGVQISSSVWELLVAEHGIDEAGNFVDTMIKEEEVHHNTFFSKTLKERYVPRTVLCDLEPTVIDEVRQGKYRNLFHPDNLVSGMEDASNNFARGFFTVGRLMTD